MTNFVSLHRARPMLTAFAVGFVTLVIALWGMSLRTESASASATFQTPAAETSATNPTGADAYDFPGAGIDVMIKLAAVLGLAYISLALLKRYTFGGALGKRGGTLQVLESTSLAPNRVIYLVRAGQKRLLLGVTPTQITTLSEWTAADDDVPADVPRSFRDHLATLPSDSVH